MFESFIRQILSCTVRLILIVMKLESVSIGYRARQRNAHRRIACLRIVNSMSS